MIFLFDFCASQARLNSMFEGFSPRSVFQDQARVATEVWGMRIVQDFFFDFQGFLAITGETRENVQQFLRKFWNPVVIDI